MSAPKAALDLSDCPYFKDPDHGKCQSGCYDEPRCVTDEPLDGWPSQGAKLVKTMTPHTDTES